MRFYIIIYSAGGSRDAPVLLSLQQGRDANGLMMIKISCSPDPRKGQSSFAILTYPR